MATKITSIGGRKTLYFATPINSITFITPAEIELESDRQLHIEHAKSGDSVFVRAAKQLTPAAPKL